MLALWFAGWGDRLTAAQVAEASRAWIEQLDPEAWQPTDPPDAEFPLDPSVRLTVVSWQQCTAITRLASGGIPRRFATGSFDRLLVCHPDTARTAIAHDSSDGSRFDHRQHLYRCLEEQRLPVRADRPWQSKRLSSHAAHAVSRITVRDAVFSFQFSVFSFQCFRLSFSWFDLAWS